MRLTANWYEANGTAEYPNPLLIVSSTE